MTNRDKEDQDAASVRGQARLVHGRYIKRLLFIEREKKDTECTSSQLQGCRFKSKIFNFELAAWSGQKPGLRVGLQ